MRGAYLKPMTSTLQRAYKPTLIGLWAQAASSRRGGHPKGLSATGAKQDPHGNRWYIQIKLMAA